MGEKALLLAVIFAISSARARAADPAPPATGWVRSDVGGALAADNPAAIERIHFGNQFQNQGLDQWCDQVPFTIPISQDLTEQLGRASILNGGAFNGNRQFFRYPNGDVAINDQLELKIDMGYALALVSQAEKTMGVFLGASIDGQSLVTRPMHGADTCKELKRLLNPLDFKTVLPLTGRRLGQMDVGELWMIPMTFQIAFEPLDAAMAQPRVGSSKLTPTASYISIGASKTTDPTITVYRAGPKEMRLKIHLDQVRAVNASIGAVFGPIPATDIGTPGMETLLSRILPSSLPGTILLFSRQIDGILGIQAGVAASRTAGRQILLQYTLDPSDPEQMIALSKVIRGDLSAIRAMKGSVFRSPDASGLALLKELDGLRESHDRALKTAADIAGIDDYRTSSKSVNFSIPVAVGYTRATTLAHDHYVTQDSRAGDIDSYKALKQSNLGFISFPVVGSVINTSGSQGTQVLVDDSDAAGASKGKPYLIYTQEWGLLRARNSVIGRAAAQSDALLSSVGTASAGDGSARLPEEIRSAMSGGRYHKGYMDLSLVLGPQAVQKIIFASADAALRSYASVLTGGQRALFDFILEKGSIGADGGVAVDPAALKGYDAYRNSDEERQSELATLASALCRKGTQLVRDLSAVRSLANDPERQAQALFRLALGKGSVGRDDFLKIALSLVSADDLAGDVLLHLDANKTSAANYTVRYVLNPLLFGDAVLKGMSTVERGFIAPTPGAPTND